MLILWYNVIVHGADLVSTGSVEYGWQVECPRHGHKKINATKIKNAVANGDLYIAKCHLCHQTGKVRLIDENLEEVGL